MKQALLDFLLPRCRCLVCNEPRAIIPGQAVCAQCTMALDRLRIGASGCGHCRSPKRSAQPCAYCAQGGMQGFDAAYAPYYYHGAVQRLVVLCKFGYCNEAAQPLAQAMAEEISGLFFDALVPIPLHASRLRERGANQAALLAQWIAAQRAIPILPALSRIRKTQRQSQLTTQQRAANVRDAFIVCQDVTGMRLLLIDDVRTTGNTARACAQALRQAGADSVSLLTAAIAPQKAEDMRLVDNQ